MSTENKSNIDVIIVGAGPAGLMAATWLAQLGVSFRIIDKRGTKVYNGQADGLHCRTIEMFDSFDIANRPVRFGFPLGTVNSWTTGKDGTLQRIDCMRLTGEHLHRPDSRFVSCTLHQGHIETILIDNITATSGVKVERGILPESMTIDESLVDDNDAYPITLRLRHLSEAEATPKAATTMLNGKAINNGLFRSNMAADDTAEVLQRSISRDATTETVSAKYVIGCDGAHSWVRKQIGIALEGSSTDYIWGVLDVKAYTDFPDARMGNTIRSSEHGSILWIPRENGLLRIYIQLSHVNEDHHDGAKFDRSKITPELIIAAGQKIMHPFRISFEDVEWWTVYQIGQRVANRFSHLDRVFLAGDAVHTHSPKAGQGMNVSMADTFNLGWKLSLALRSLSDRGKILSTYERERLKVARDLISFDTKLSTIFSSAPDPEDMAASFERLAEVYQENLQFMTGMGVDYTGSLLTAAQSEKEVGEMRLGCRIGDYPAISQGSDAPIYVHRLLKTDGRFRVLLFPGDLTIGEQAERLKAVCERMQESGSFIRRFTPRDKEVDHVFEVLAIHAGRRMDFADYDWPRILKPFNESGSGWDYEKVLADDHRTRTYEKYGIDPKIGCAVIVRPDQYVSWIGQLDDYDGMGEFFDGFMKKQEVEHQGAVGAPEGWAKY